MARRGFHIMKMPMNLPEAFLDVLLLLEISLPIGELKILRIPADAEGMNYCSWWEKVVRA